MVGRHSKSKSGFFRCGMRFSVTRREERRIREKALTNLELMGLAHRAHELAENLPFGEQRLLEMAKALATDPKLFLLDAPSLGLAPMIVLDIFRTLVELHKSGLPIVLVEQNAKLALMACQYGYILENGRIVLHGKTSELLIDEKVKHAYLGKKKESIP